MHTVISIQRCGHMHTELSPYRDVVTGTDTELSIYRNVVTGNTELSPYRDVVTDIELYPYRDAVSGTHSYLHTAMWSQT